MRDYSANMLTRGVRLKNPNSEYCIHSNKRRPRLSAALE